MDYWGENKEKTDEWKVNTRRKKGEKLSKSEDVEKLKIKKKLRRKKKQVKIFSLENT